MSTASLSAPGRLGAIRDTKPRGDRPPVTQSYSALSQVVKESGLLRRTPWFYGLLLGGLTLALSPDALLHGGSPDPRRWTVALMLPLDADTTVPMLLYAPD